MSALRGAHFVGAAFERWPFISGIGALLRVTRLNRYLPSDYRFAFGLTVHHRSDLNHLMTFSAKRKDQLAAALRVDENVRQYWELERWLPFHCDEAALELEHRFRYCPTCLRHGHHSLLHQLPWIERCPAHGNQLRTSCLKCGSQLRLNGLVPSWLGTCKCGYDHVDERLAIGVLQAKQAMEDACQTYLQWACERRGQTYLIAPSPSGRSMAMLAGAFALPRGLEQRTKARCHTVADVHRSIVRPEPQGRRGTEDAGSIIVKLDHLADDRAAMIEAPGRLAIRISHIAMQLARQLPPGSLSDEEMSLFLEPAGVVADRSFVPARRRSILEIKSLPLTLVGSRSYLDLHCISKLALHVAHRTLQVARIGESPGAALWRFPLDADLQACISAVNEIVARGYAEGIRIAMGHHLPDLYRAGRNRPRQSEPWVLLHRTADSPLSIEIFWARLPHNQD